MKTNLLRLTFGICVLSLSANAASLLVKLRETSPEKLRAFEAKHGGQLEVVSSAGNLYLWKGELETTLTDANVEYAENNQVIELFPIPGLQGEQEGVLDATDNPAIEEPSPLKTGPDPLLPKSWALSSIHAALSHSVALKGEEIIVAVTDTGIDYNHEDLQHKIWHNPNEVEGDGIDNDENGFVDDLIGWDFSQDDNLPYDYVKSVFKNPGHGTHCAGVIAASYQNSLGLSGVATHAKIMPLRMFNENGQGDLAVAIRAIDYAVANGAKIISASWGFMGEDENSEALQESIARAEKADVLFVAAAGNGRAGKGFSNDLDPKPALPATFPHDNIISVAAIDSNDALGVFSNWGETTVDIAAPGVKVLSTVPGNKYQDLILNLGIMKVAWDGTSMAAPHISGAAAVLWALNPEFTSKEIKKILLENAAPVEALAKKVVSGGKLDLERILK